MLRILLNATTVLSLVLCLAAMAAWVRSYPARDVVWWSLAKPRMLLGVDTYRGGLTFGVFTPVFRDPIVPPGMGWGQHTPVSFAEAGRPQGTFFNTYGMDDRQNGLGQWAREAFNRFGVVLHLHQNGFYQTRELACPYWFIVLATAILPVARLAGWRRRARRLRMRPGFCRQCGYDCRATPDRCPECGRVLAAAKRGASETEGV
jgi:hypothetical protein